MISGGALPKSATDYRCHCGADGVFGYRTADHSLVWFCAEHRRGQWYADACIGKPEVVSGAASDGPPDPQDLIALHGGYDKIPSELWAAFDLAMSEWQTRRREKFRGR